MPLNGDLTSSGRIQQQTSLETFEAGSRRA